ncbi:MAG: hypothetical protein KDE62_01635 [Calditrichaeota bacterium]|nr:hypothetical protein [Calditrichota bacterium]
MLGKTKKVTGISFPFRMRVFIGEYDHQNRFNGNIQRRRRRNISQTVLLNFSGLAGPCAELMGEIAGGCIRMRILPAAAVCCFHGRCGDKIVTAGIGFNRCGCRLMVLLHHSGFRHRRHTAAANFRANIPANAGSGEMIALAEGMAQPQLHPAQKLEHQDYGQNFISRALHLYL